MTVIKFERRRQKNSRLAQELPPIETMVEEPKPTGYLRCPDCRKTLRKGGLVLHKRYCKGKS